jgi:hypothetical protein
MTHDTPPDQFAAYKVALAGGKMDFGPKGQPSSGYFKHNVKQGIIEAVAIWRDKHGALQCKRSIFGDGAKMDADQIDELLASCGHYPIPHDVWLAITKEGKPWPLGYNTRLTMDEIKRGVTWTPELGRKKMLVESELAEDKAKAENFKQAVAEEFPAATATKDLPDGEAGAGGESSPAPIGHNNPPDESNWRDDEELAAQVAKLEEWVSSWLKVKKSAIDNKDDADKLADYATKFGEYKATAVAKHKVEKQPHLDAGREVDTRWFAIRDKADKLRVRCLEIVSKYIRGEQDRRNATAATENAKIADEGTTRPAVEAERVKVGNARSVSARDRVVYVVDNPRMFCGYLLSLTAVPPDLTEALRLLAARLGPAMEKIGQVVPGITKTTVERTQ